MKYIFRNCDLKNRNSELELKKSGKFRQNRNGWQV